MLELTIHAVRKNAKIVPAPNRAVAHTQIGLQCGNVDTEASSRNADQGEASQIQRDVIGSDGDPIRAADAGHIRRQIVRSWQADGERCGGDRHAGFNLIERLHGRRGRARRREVALGEAG